MSREGKTRWSPRLLPCRQVEARQGGGTQSRLRSRGTDASSTTTSDPVLARHSRFGIPNIRGEAPRNDLPRECEQPSKCSIPSCKFGARHPSWLLSGTAPILLQGPPPLDTLRRCSLHSCG